MQDEPWFCYMLRCRDGSLYVGMTNDVAARVEKHNLRIWAGVYEEAAAG